MKRRSTRSTDAAVLRILAEAQYSQGHSPVTSPATEAEMRRVIHELEVHKIELEMQNEELRQAQGEVEAGLERFTELYDFAPVGYFTLDRVGAIRQANLNGTHLLGVERSRLLGARFGLFIANADRPAFAACLQKVFAGQAKETCEVALHQDPDYPAVPQLSTSRSIGNPGHRVVRIEAEAAEDRLTCRIVALDITERKRYEDTLLFLSQSEWLNSGENFFRALARYLAESLEMDYVCIDRLSGDGQSIPPLAVFLDGQFVDHATRALRENPCGDGADTKICCYPRSVRSLLPQEWLFQDLLAESYIGVTLSSYTGQAIGRIMVIGRKPLAAPHLAESILKAVAVRASGELERSQMEDALRRSARDFSTLVENASDMIVRLDRGLHNVYANPAAAQQLGIPLDRMIGKTPLEVGAPLQQAEFIVQAMQTALDTGEEVEVEQSYPLSSGLKHLQTRIIPERDPQGRIESLLTITRDITGLKRVEEETRRLNTELDQEVDERTVELENAVNLLEEKISQLELAQEETRQYADEAQHQAARAGALLHTASQINARLDLKDMLNTVCAETARVLSVPAVHISLYNELDNVFELVSCFGFPPDFLQRCQPFPFHPVNRLFARLGGARTPIFPDLSEFSNFPNVMFHIELGIRTVMSITITHEEEMLGLLSVFGMVEGRPFSQAEQVLLQGLADQAAQAIVNARLFEQVSAGQKRLHTLSQALIDLQENERRRLALELHDQLGQMLSSAKISLDMISTLPRKAAAGHIQRAQELVGELITQVRRMALELRPSMLDDMGLLPALNWLFKSYQAQSGEAVLFEHTALDQRFPPQVEITAYRIIQEALTNVSRHAQTRQVSVSAWSDGQSLNLQIADHGVGFDPVSAQVKGETSGLSGMRERARLLGGELRIESAPGAGARLSARLPLVFIPERA